MTTNINKVLDTKDDNVKSDIFFPSDLENDEYLEIITDLSLPLDYRIIALEKYCSLPDMGDNAIDVFSALAGMYQMSGSKLIEQFFYHVCMESKISSFLKLESAKNLLEYEEVINEENCDKVLENNNNRKLIGYKAMDHVCKNLKDIAAPCRVDVIFRLMDSDIFCANACTYFQEFVTDDMIDCKFRYNAILSLENVGKNTVSKELISLFNDADFVDYVYNKFNKMIENIFPGKKKINRQNRKYWDKIFEMLTYDDLRDMYTDKFPSKNCGKDFFIREAQMAFLFHEPNLIYYRILSGQYLLQKFVITGCVRNKVEDQILLFAEDRNVDYDRRADAADILIRLGTGNRKEKARNIIAELGKNSKSIHTVFDNAQNVHVEEIEESVVESLEHLNNVPLLKIEGKTIDFDYVNSQIENIIKQDKLNRQGISSRVGKEVCDYCDGYIHDKFIYESKKFCSQECSNFFFRDGKVRLAMNRILIDRVLYSRFNNSLNSILIKVWSYISNHEFSIEMKKRLIQELEEMCDTCSSGFATRLINTLSGFGDFNIRISWQDQIISNFSGRLNASARNITSENSIFRKDPRLHDIIALWLNNQENISILKNCIEEITQERDIKIVCIDCKQYIGEKGFSSKLCKKCYNKIIYVKNLEPSMKDIIKKFLSVDREEKIELCVQSFAESVMNELTLSSSNTANRQNFLLFFRVYMPSIREELYEEFKNFVDNEEFDMAFRKSIMSYEGEL